MFENTFKNVDDILHKDAGCSSELDYVEQSSWVLFLKYLEDLEKSRALAKELAVPVIALSQLSRAVESREDKRPQLSDLRESGSIEQDADVVMFIYRDEYYLQQRIPKQIAFDNDDKFNTALEKWQRDMEAVHNRAELLIEKQRHGPTGKIDLMFEGEFTRYADIDLVHGPDDGY